MANKKKSLIIFFVGLIMLSSNLYAATWASPIDQSAAGESASQPQISFNDSGEAVAIWTRFDGSNQIIQAAVFSSGVWGAPTDLSSEGFDAELPHVKINSLGNAVASWVLLGSSNILQVANLVSGVWSAP